MTNVRRCVANSLISSAATMLLLGAYLAFPMIGFASFQTCVNNKVGTTCGTEPGVTTCDSNALKECNATDTACKCYQRNNGCPCGKDA